MRKVIIMFALAMGIITANAQAQTPALLQFTIIIFQMIFGTDIIK